MILTCDEIFGAQSQVCSGELQSSDGSNPFCSIAEIQIFLVGSAVKEVCRQVEASQSVEQSRLISSSWLLSESMPIDESHTQTVSELWWCSKHTLIPQTFPKNGKANKARVKIEARFSVWRLWEASPQLRAMCFDELTPSLPFPNKGLDDFMDCGFVVLKCLRCGVVWSDGWFKQKSGCVQRAETALPVSHSEFVFLRFLFQASEQVVIRSKFTCREETVSSRKAWHVFSLFISAAFPELNTVSLRWPLRFCLGLICDFMEKHGRM